MQWLLFLRGVNVGGKNKLPMAEFRDHLATAGCQNVFSYIQSGNVVFDHESRSQKTVAGLVQRVFEQQYEFVPSLFLVTSKSLQEFATQTRFQTRKMSQSSCTSSSN